jgi:hypothetical protein
MADQSYYPQPYYPQPDPSQQPAQPANGGPQAEDPHQIDWKPTNGDGAPADFSPAPPPALVNGDNLGKQQTPTPRAGPTFTNLVVAIARETMCYVGLESAPGIQTPVTDPGMKMVMTAGAGSVAQAMRKLDDPQYRNTLSKLDPIIASFDTGKWSLPMLVKTVAGTGTPPTPEIEPLLVGLFGTPSYTTQNAWFGANTRAYLLKKVNPAGTVYPSITIWFKVGHTMYVAVGATVNVGEFNVAGNDLCKCNFSGEFMRMGYAGTDTCVSNSGTALVVADATKYFIPDPTAGDILYICAIDPVTGVTKGNASVTAVDYSTNTLTITGSLTAAAGDLIAPYLPPGTETGTPLVGKYGITRIGGVPSTKVQASLPTSPYVITTGRVTLTNNIKYHTDLKDGKYYPTEYVSANAREVTGEVTLFDYRNIPQFMYKALRDPLYLDYVIFPMEDRQASQGRIAEIHCPRVSWESPTLAGEDEKTATIAFKTTASTAWDDELAFMFGEAESSSPSAPPNPNAPA